MASKLAVKKPVFGKVSVKKSAPSIAVQIAPKGIKTKRPSHGGEITKIARTVKLRVPTAATLQALAELKARKGTRYVDEDDLFKKLGIKVGKA